jgi:SagB-type dehydrogenase family enzyme
MENKASRFVRTVATERMEEMNKKLLVHLLQNSSTNGEKLSDILNLTPESNGIQQSPVQLEYDTRLPIYPLPKPQDIKVDKIDIRSAIENRRSIRSYSEDSLTLDELAWLLWATHGVRDVQVTVKRTRVLRNVPSGGSLHPFETYLIIDNVGGLKPGLYRYLGLSHELLQIREVDGMHEILSELCGYQPWIKKGAISFLWSFVPDRSIWRYSWGACKLFMEAGHICQNLYLAAEAVRCGVCAIGAFDLDEIHKLLGVDSNAEIIVYIATLGKRK